MSTIMSIIIAVVVAGAVMTVSYALNAEEGINSILKDKKMIANSIAAGGIIGLVSFFTGKMTEAAAWTSLIFFVALVVFSVMLIRWWKNAEVGDEPKIWLALLGLAAIAFVHFLVMKSVATIATIIITETFWASVVNAIPVIILIVEIGFLLYATADFYSEEED